jgi:hypothetical protein
MLDVSQDSMAQHLTSGISQLDGDSSFPPRTRMTIVPQGSYAKKRRDKKQEVLTFKVNGHPGITARDAMRKIYVGLEGRDERVFEDKPSVLTLRLQVRSVVFFVIL